MIERPDLNIGTERQQARKAYKDELIKGLSSARQSDAHEARITHLEGLIAELSEKLESSLSLSDSVKILAAGLILNERPSETRKVTLSNGTAMEVNLDMAEQAAEDLIGDVS